MVGPLRILFYRHQILHSSYVRQAQNAVHRRNITTHSSVLTSSRPPPPDDEDSAPLRFSTSRAATWRAADTFGGGADDEDIPWYQVPSVLISVTSLLIYFCVLREENDIDAQLGVSVLDRVPGLEKKSLEVYVAHQERVGGPVEREKARLEELKIEDENRIEKQR